MNQDQAEELVKEVLLEIVPDADLTSTDAQTDFRRELELDSMDFLTLVERLSVRAGCRIDEDDYPRMATLAGSAALLAERT
ncbi:phosphopantetheine-binding protein [Kitasatospora sp. NPDC051914]|uniref:acyl carrier protein n=1 Tax=Kitasatospora sp. NPDC051914 TaxID=3154945 RepID=UPI00343B2542